MDKDIRFTEKHVDEDWKASVSRGASENQSPQEERETHDNASLLASFITSLGVQCLMHLGEWTPSEQERPAVNLAAAQETIDLLLLLKEKTKGNLTQQEEQLFVRLIADLQVKFVHRSSRGQGQPND